MRKLLVACLVAACRSSTLTSDASAPPPAASTTMASSSSSGPLASAAAVGFGRGAARPTAHDVFERWNDAHNRHDAKALESLYAPRVGFYGKTLTNKECAEKKGAAFEKSPDYAQSAKKVTFYPSSEADQALGKTAVWFTKTSVVGGKSTDYPAVLGIAPDGLVTFESDDITNQRMAMAWFEAQNWCTRPGNAPNDSLIDPYKISAKSAIARVRRSKYFASIRGDGDASASEDLDDFMTCPYSCDRAEPRGCHYEMGIIDPADRRFVHALIYVDAVTGELSYQWADGWHTETLPP